MVITADVKHNRIMSAEWLTICGLCNTEKKL